MGNVQNAKMWKWSKRKNVKMVKTQKGENSTIWKRSKRKNMKTVKKKQKNAKKKCENIQNQKI